MTKSEKRAKDKINKIKIEGINSRHDKSEESVSLKTSHQKLFSRNEENTKNSEKNLQGLCDPIQDTSTHIMEF